jgi:diaminopimelate decarboxylase
MHHCYNLFFSFHIGVGFRNPNVFDEAIAHCRRLFDIGQECGHYMRLLDIGGGFPSQTNGSATFQEVHSFFSHCNQLILDTFFQLSFFNLLHHHVTLILF